MKHSTSGANNEQDIRIIFDDIPDFDYQDTLAGDLINWEPLYDLYIIGDNVVVTIEIAGVDISDFSIYIRKKDMIIDGSRKSPTMASREYCVFHNLEIPYGRFNRRIDFPIPIESRRYQYKIENGILTLIFPRLKEKVIPVE